MRVTPREGKSLGSAEVVSWIAEVEVVEAMTSIAGSEGCEVVTGFSSRVISGRLVNRDEEVDFRGPTGVALAAEATSIPRFLFKGLGELACGLSCLLVPFSEVTSGAVTGTDFADFAAGTALPVKARLTFILSHLFEAALSFHLPLYCEDAIGMAGVLATAKFRRSPSSAIGRQN